MKPAILATVLLTLLSCLTLHAESDNNNREFAKKDLVLSFASSAEASKWSLEALDLSEWVKTVSLNGWKLLHKSQTPEFNFAVFESSGHLIFWKLNRKGLYDSARTTISAKDPKVEDVEVGPGKWMSLNMTRRFPEGAYIGHCQGDVTQIKKDFKGEIIYSYSVSKNNGKETIVFKESSAWPPMVEQADLVQPDEKPTDETHIKVQPSPTR